MATKGGAEKFCNVASITVQESAINTLTYQKLETGVATFEKIAWIIHKIDYYTGSITAANLNADGDLAAFGLTTSNQRTTLLSSPTFQDPSVIDIMWLARRDFGAAATSYIQQIPWTHDFTNLPGTGLIVPPMPLYLAAQGSGLTAVLNITARIYYSLLQLSVEDYWELVESTRILASS